MDIKKLSQKGQAPLPTEPEESMNQIAPRRASRLVGTNLPTPTCRVSRCVGTTYDLVLDAVQYFEIVSKY